MKHPTFKPQSDKVIIFKDKPKEKTLGGIIKPDSSQRVPCTGTVLGIGPGSQRDTASGPNDMKGLAIGDRVLFMDHEGFNFKLHTVPYLSVPVRYVLAKLESKEFTLD